MKCVGGRVVAFELMQILAHDPIHQFCQDESDGCDTLLSLVRHSITQSLICVIEEPVFVCFTGCFSLRTGSVVDV